MQLTFYTTINQDFEKKKKNNRQAHTSRDKTMKVFVMGLMAGII